MDPFDGARARVAWTSGAAAWRSCTDTPFREWERDDRPCGLPRDRLLEPRPDPTTLATCRQLEDCARVPYFLILEVRKKAEG